MITWAQYDEARRRAVEMYTEAGVLARPDEVEGIEVVDLGLGELEETGLQIMTLVSTGEIGVKVLALFPQQVFAQHKHPPLENKLTGRSSAAVADVALQQATFLSALSVKQRSVRAAPLRTTLIPVSFRTFPRAADVASAIAVTSTAIR